MLIAKVRLHLRFRIWFSFDLECLWLPIPNFSTSGLLMNPLLIWAGIRKLERANIIARNEFYIPGILTRVIPCKLHIKRLRSLGGYRFRKPNLGIFNVDLGCRGPSKIGHVEWILGWYSDIYSRIFSGVACWQYSIY